MFKRSVLAAMLVMLAAGLSAYATRATMILDELEQALDASRVVLLNEAIPDTKRIKVIDALLAKVDKTTTTTLGDLKLLKKVAVNVEKKLSDDAGVQTGLDTALTAGTDATQPVIDEAAVVISGAVENRKRKNVDKLRARAQRLLDKAVLKPKKRKVANGLFNALKAANKASVQAQKLTPDGLNGLKAEDVIAEVFLVSDGAGGARRIHTLELAPRLSRLTEFLADGGDLAVETVLADPTGRTVGFGQGRKMRFLDVETRGIVTTTPESDWYLTKWSADGRWLAAAGTNPDRLVIFSSGGEVMFSRDVAVTFGIPRTETLSFAPTTAPDPGILLYRTDVDGNGVRELNTTRVDTQATTMISTEATAPPNAMQASAWISASTLAYVAVDNTGSNTNHRLVLSSPDGTSKETVSGAQENVAGSAGRAIDPIRSFTPNSDGTLLTYVTKETNGNAALFAGKRGPQPLAKIAEGDQFDQIEVAADDRILYILDGELLCCTLEPFDCTVIANNVHDFKVSEDGLYCAYRAGATRFADNDIFLCDLRTKLSTLASPHRSNRNATAGTEYSFSTDPETGRTAVLSTVDNREIGAQDGYVIDDVRRFADVLPEVIFEGAQFGEVKLLSEIIGNFEGLDKGTVVTVVTRFYGICIPSSNTWVICAQDYSQHRDPLFGHVLRKWGSPNCAMSSVTQPPEVVLARLKKRASAN